MSTALYFADAVLTNATTDADGDVIRPGGVDLTRFSRSPFVGYAHLWHDGTGNSTRVGKGRPLIAGWLRRSLARPGAPTEIELHRVGVFPALTCRIYFDNDKLSRICFEQIVAREIKGVSIEAGVRQMREIGYRKGRIVSDWRLLGVTLCRRPANPDAQIVKYGYVRGAKPLSETFNS